MKKAQWTDLFREIRKSRGRYLSLLFIVALGTAFYAGVRSAEPDMTASVDRYYDETDFMDVRVMGTLGLTEDDLKAVADTEGIDRAEGGYSAELFAVCDNDQPVMSVVSSCEEMNRMTIEAGRMPQTADECFMDVGFMNKQGYEIGDQVTLTDESGNAPEDLKTDTFTIVGSGTWSWYLSWSRGSASIGDGSVDAFMVVQPEAFDMDCYTVIYTQVSGVGDMNTFTDEYDDAVALVTDRLEEIAGERCDIRRTEVYDEANAKLSDAKKEVADAEQELADAETELTDGEKEYEDGLKEYEDGLAQYEEGKQSYEDGLAEYEDGLKKYEDGLKSWEDGKQEYESGLTEYKTGEQKLLASRKELDDGWAEYRAGVSALSDAQKQLLDSQTQLETGEQQLADGQKELESGQKELDTKKSELDQQAEQVSQGLKSCEEGEAQIAAAEKELASKEQELASGQAAYEAGLKEHEAGEAQLEEAAASLQSGCQQIQAAQAKLDGLLAQAEQAKAAYGEDSDEYQQLMEQYNQGNAALQAQKTALEQSQAEYDAAAEQLAASGETLDQTAAQLESGEKQLEEGKAELQAQKEALAASKKQLTEAQSQIESGYVSISSAQEELDAGQKTLQEKEAELNAGKKQLESGQAQADSSVKQLAAAKKQLDEGETAYASGKSQLDDSKKELDDGEKELADSKKQLDDAEKELSEAKQTLDDSWKKLEDARLELLDARKELDDGWKEYEDALSEAEPKLADARAEIADGEKELTELPEAKWYVLDRDTVQTSVEYGMDAQRIGAIGKVFPAIFFLVAALVSLTTMTRMIEEERTLIGTMKALGYGKISIAGKYILYAFSATMAGGIFGVLLGSTLIPYVIMTAYNMLYSNTGYMLMPYHPGVCIFSIGLALLCTVGAAFAACYKELLSTPASLMRPPAPKQGRRVFLERIPFIWKRLNFSMKSTIRNLMRYKKRLFMTVFGIGGCMSLLLVSFGLHDSIAEIVNKQYKTIWTYSASCNIDEDISLEEKQELIREVTEEQPDIESGMLARRISLDVYTEEAEKTVYFFTAQDQETMKDYLDLHNRTTGEKYDLTDDGVILTEKLARTLDVQPGDTITLKLDDADRREVKVTAIAENYLYNYIYLSPVFYEELYGEEPEYNELFLKFTEGTGSQEENELAQYLLEKDSVTSVSLVTSLQATVDDMMNALNLVVWVLIISAGLLVFVVLFNLNNINISERRRELASLKVLGFYDMEVAMYVYRENVFLTAFGILAGVFMGTWLHRYMILTLEVDMIMFGRNISPQSYLYSVLFTIAFAVFVNGVMYRKLKQIDMVESLKSVE
ncbi:MAG: FtsX-like permease family protein [Lachnospiraceae bacterium]|nr:FtsX-like permease family protein [Lachnospiraceae bacterium]